MRSPVRAFALAAATTLAGCEIVAGLNGNRFVESGTGGGAGTGGAMCQPATPPPPPKSGSAGGTDTFTVALYSIDLGEMLGTMLPRVGFDLDHTCTCPGPPSCAEPMWASGSHCDGPGGIDNASAQAFAGINNLIGTEIDSPQFSALAQSGAWSMIIQVSGYNGGSDDPDVQTAFYTTTGFPAGTTLAWDGTDMWPIGDNSLAGGAVGDGGTDDGGDGGGMGDGGSDLAPLFADASAYVSGGVLVTKLPRLPVLFLGSNGIRLQIDLSDVEVAASIVPTDAGQLRLTKGTLAARWKVSDIFQDLSGLRATANFALCTNSQPYPSIKQQICQFADLASSAGGASAPCDALSFGMSFEAYPAALGAPSMIKPPTGGCSSSLDPAYDTCK